MKRLKEEQSWEGHELSDQYCILSTQYLLDASLVTLD